MNQNRLVSKLIDNAGSLADTVHITTVNRYNDPATILADNTTLRRINDDLRRKIWGLEQLAADYKKLYEQMQDACKQSDRGVDKCVAHIKKLEEGNNGPK